MKLIREPISQESSVFLNLIRFVSCEFVVIGHFLTRYQPVTAETSLRLGRTLGGAAVLLFFFLSGLLIAYSLCNKIGNPEYRFRNYFVDRFSRIYSGLLPALLLGTLITVVIYITNYAYFVDLCSMQSTPSAFTFIMTLGMLESFPVGFFKSVFSVFGLSFPFPEISPFGFNGILWTLVILWWIYMAFGWIVIGSIGFIRKKESSRSYKAIFFVVATFLILLLMGMYQENSSLVTIWFLGALMMLAITNKTVNTKIKNNVATLLLRVLFILSLASVLYGMYSTFAWTDHYYGLGLGLLLSACVSLGVLFFNVEGFKPASRLILNKHVVSLITQGASFSYTLFVTHYPIIIFLNGLNLPVNRYLMFLPILLLSNLIAFSIAYFTEKKHKELSKTLKKWLRISQ